MSFQDQIRQNVLDIRAAAADFLIDTCQIRRRVSDTIINGENVVTYADPVTSACRLIIRSGSDSSNVAAQERAISITMYTGIYRLQLPYNTSINVNDKILFEGRTFDVVFVPPFNDMMGAFVIGIKEVQ